MAVPNRYNGGGPLAGVVVVDVSGAPLPMPTPAADGSTPITGGNGSSVASPANPVPVASGVLPAGTDRSGTATTTSGALTVAANANRTFLVGQNVGVNNIGFNEFGGTAVIGGATTYTVAPGSSFSVSTRNAVTFIAATGNTLVTMTEG